MPIKELIQLEGPDSYCSSIMSGSEYEPVVQVQALEGQGAPDVRTHANIPVAKLPHDSGKLLRPGVVWYASEFVSLICLEILACLDFAMIRIVLHTPRTGIRKCSHCSYHCYHYHYHYH